MTQLHEILAVEKDLLNTKEQIKNETKNTFSQKAQHFMGQVKKLEMFDEKRHNEEAEEHIEMVTTVPKKLDWLAEHLIKFWDVKYKHDIANQKAVGDVIVDGKLVRA